MIAQAGPASADTVGAALYRERLDAARAALVTALNTDQAARAPHLDRARALLGETTALRLADGSAVAIDDSRVAARITQSDAAIRAAIDDIAALAEAATRRRAVDPAAAEAQLRQRVGEHRASDAEMTFIQLLARWLASFASDLRGSPPDTRVVYIGVGGLGIAILLLVLGIIGRDLRERFRREAVLPELRAAGRPDPAAHLRMADEALRAGAVRDAIHALYLYAIAALAQREAIRYDPSLTDRELLARAGSIPHADALRDLVEIHDRVWYGLRDARVEDAARAGQLARRAAA